MAGIPLRNLSSSGQTINVFSERTADTAPVTDTRTSDAGLTVNFLTFVDLLWKLKIPTINPCILDGSKSVTAANGTLGRGGQYMVDRIYDNQRYPDQYGLRSETNIVYKRVLATQVEDENSLYHESRMLESFVREVKALGHLRTHTNIVKLLGIAWEEARVDDICPVLVLEYAQHNSLTKFLSSDASTPLSFQQKRAFCSDIANGMSCVHGAGFIWGDCKPENVLIFQDENDPTSLKAKISDFGCSVSHFTADTHFPGYSVPWTAPEARDCAGFQAMVKAEIYSYGMLVWAVALDGRQFKQEYWQEGGATGFGKGHVSTARIEELKRENQLTEIAVASVKRYVAQVGQKQSPIASPAGIDLLVQIITGTMESDVNHRLAELGSVALRLSSVPPTKIEKVRLPDFNGEVDHAYLSKMYGPETRLKQVASAIFRRLLEFSHSTQSMWGFYEASICCAVGFGTEADASKAMSLMRKSAALGFSRAQGLYARLLSIVQSSIETSASEAAVSTADGEEDLIHFDDFDFGESTSRTSRDLTLPGDNESHWLWQATATGSRFAATELHDHDMEAFHTAIDALRSRYEGVGILLDGPKVERLISSGKSLGRSACNARGDSLLHRAAVEGDEESLNVLLEKSENNIDARNSDGETPLICAMRAGHASIAESLLHHGADRQLTDLRGVTALHWVISMDSVDLEQLRECFADASAIVASTTVVSYSRHYGTILEPGTPLDWAVDVRNLDAVGFLLGLKADPMVETPGRPPALHRVSARHDSKVCELLLTAVSPADISRLDTVGESALSYSLQRCMSFDRLLISGQSKDGFENQLNLLVSHGSDISYVNELGENAIYCAVRRGDREVTNAVIPCLGKDSKLLRIVTTKTGLNRWSSVRRALYAEQRCIFRSLCEKIRSKELLNLGYETSPDGLTLLHEFAFCPDDAGLEHAKAFFESIGTRRLQLAPLQKHRLLKRRDRARLTPFQLAVLCQKFELADYLISRGQSPLAGVERVRFLGYLIQYQNHDAYDPSTYLCQITDDPVVNTLRRFPHPASVRSSIVYLLRNDSVWWDLRRHGGMSGYFLDATIPIADRDPEHDPLIDWRPGFFTAINACFVDNLPWDSDDRALAQYGMSGFLDSNTLAFQHRSRHARDFGSFLVCYREETQNHSAYGHGFVTALELAFDTVLQSPYQEQAEQVFFTVLDRFRGPLYCNFPYFHYYPHGRTRWANLRRRETILHRAIRARKPAIVEHLLAAGADWNMANANWQSPLHLAGMITNPDLRMSHGSFLQRLSPMRPFISESSRLSSASNSPSLAILAVLEEHAVNAPPSRPWAPIRALREVRWPWDEYETDDLGVRFIIYYAFVIPLVVVLIALPTQFFMGTVPRAVIGFFSAVFGGDDFLPAMKRFAGCYMDCYHNGSDPRVLCTALSFEPIQVLLEDLIPTFQPFQIHSLALVDVFDRCYNGSIPEWLHNDTYVEPDEYPENATWVPGCRVAYWEEPEAVNAFSAFSKAEADYLKDKCRCACTWPFGKPYRKPRASSIRVGPMS